MRSLLACLPIVVFTLSCGSSGVDGSTDAADESETSVEDVAEEPDTAEEHIPDVVEDDGGMDVEPDEPLDTPEVVDVIEDDGGEPPTPTHFAFAVIADSHVTGTGENADRLATAVAWVNTHAADRSDAVYADIAGHVHLFYEQFVAGGGYTVYATDATWDDDNQIALVTADGDGTAFTYTYERINVE